MLLIDCTIVYVKLITFHGLHDKLATNVQRQLSQYEKNPANMEKTKPICDSANQMQELGRP